MSTWADDIVQALERLGGEAHLADIHQAVAALRPGPLPTTFAKIIQRTLQAHSSDSAGFKGVDLFYSKGKGSGVWGLRAAAPQGLPRASAPAYRAAMESAGRTSTRPAVADQIQASLQAGRGLQLVGRAASGKSQLVRTLVPDAAYVRMTEGGFQSTRFMLDCARQLNGQGRAVLDAWAHGDAYSALSHLEAGLRGRTLVVDQAERLRRTGANEAYDIIRDEPASALRKWLTERVYRTPTLLVGRHPLPDLVPVRYAPGGEVGGSALGYFARRPASQPVLGALLPTLSADDIELLSEDLLGAEQPVDSALDLSLERLARLFWERGPEARRQTLALCRALEGLPHGIIRRVLDDDEGAALDALIELQVVRVDDGRIGLPPFLAPAIDGAEAPIKSMRRVAEALVAGVNQRSSLEPKQAEPVFQAHAIYVQLGDFESAERLAGLHLGGLIELARNTATRLKDPGTAWRYYGRIKALLPPGGSPHQRSYVLHYEAHNGRRAERLDAESAWLAYTEASALWPENALWHSRTISTLIELGRLRDAEAALDQAQRQVPPHPLRDEVLRMGPARAALEGGVGDFGLALAQPLILQQGPLSPDGATRLEMLLERWQAGVQVQSLRQARGDLLFVRPLTLKVGKPGALWVANLENEWRVDSAEGPAQAVRALADHLVERTRWLLKARVVELGEEGRRHKGWVIDHIDLLNSDLGYTHRSHRWLMGRIVGGRFVPLVDFDPVDLGPMAGVVEPEAPGIWLGRVPVFKDGHPRGPVERLEPAGSGRSLPELLEVLRGIEAQHG
jgi:hypothetical protein